jgi:hypothetical protein
MPLEPLTQGEAAIYNNNITGLISVSQNPKHSLSAIFRSG